MMYSTLSKFAVTTFAFVLFHVQGPCQLLEVLIWRKTSCWLARILRLYFIR